MMSSITSSYKNYNPTVTYMRGKGSNGIRRIGNKVVFLNGHGNYDNMTFSQSSKGSDYMTGVYYGKDLDSSKSGIKYVGLTDSATNLSSVDLISFVGCKTASGSVNLASRARSEGANTAVGFTNNINSRNSNGPNWLKKYNDSLANGNTVTKAINYATTLYPSSNLGDYVKIYGSTGNTIAYQKENVMELNTTHVSSDISIIDPVQYKVNIDLNLNEDNNIVDENLSNYKKDYDVIISELGKIDSSFKVDEYKLTVNIYSPEEGNGIIKFTYFIDDMIKTNKAYIAIVEGNRVTQINESYIETGFTTTSSINEIDKVNKVSRHIKNTGKKSYKELKVSNNYESVFLYDYNTGELKYVETDYVESDILDGAIVPISKEVVIN